MTHTALNIGTGTTALIASESTTDLSLKAIIVAFTLATQLVILYNNRKRKNTGKRIPGSGSANN